MGNMQRANPVTFFAMKIYKFFLAYMGWKVPKHLISKLTIPDPGSRFKNVPVYCIIDLRYIYIYIYSTSKFQSLRLSISWEVISWTEHIRESDTRPSYSEGTCTVQYSTEQYSTVQYSTASVPQYWGPQPLPRPASTLAALTTIHSPADEMGTWWILCRLCTDDCSFVSSCGLYNMYNI